MTGSGGLLQLVAQGKQDIYLTGNPEISWFKMVYRRYTNFAIESQAMYFDGDPDFGKKMSCLIPRRGDLLGPIVLEITLPALTLTTGAAVAYVNSIGHAIIDEITLEIGEQKIDSQTGEWMEIWSNFTTSASQLAGFNIMIGKVEGYNAPTTPTSTDNIKLYIPLRFWFCSNPGQYLPLLALQYHPLRINLTLRKLQDLFAISAGQDCNTVSVNPVKIVDLRMYGDYVYLDVDERRKFVSNTHEYLIEQVQYTSLTSVPIGATSSSIRIEFNHPIRELFWFIQRARMLSNHEYFNYSNLSPIDTATIPATVRTNLIQDAMIQLDGFDRFDRRDADYFRLVQPYFHHTVVPSTQYIYNYCFALRPEEQQPSGSLNASRIDNLVLQINYNTTTTASRGNAYSRVYAKNHNILRIVDGFGGLLFTI